jgi:hypothetical protein
MDTRLHSALSTKIDAQAQRLRHGLATDAGKTRTQEEDRRGSRSHTCRVATSYMGRSSYRQSCSRPTGVLPPSSVATPQEASESSRQSRILQRHASHGMGEASDTCVVLGRDAHESGRNDSRTPPPVCGSTASIEGGLARLWLVALLVEEIIGGVRHVGPVADVIRQATARRWRGSSDGIHSLDEGGS